MSDRLSFLDTMFLDLEEADPSAHMHIGAALIFEPLSEGGAPALDALRAQLRQRLGLLPRYAQKLSWPTTSAIAWRTWEPAEVDLTTHVRRATLPAGATEDDLHDWLGDFWSHRLDRRLPLWELVLVDGLPDGGWCLASKTHHCLVDGVGSLDIGYALLDMEAEPRATISAPIPDRPAAEHPHRFPMVSPGVVLHRAKAAAEVVRHPLETAQTVAAMTELLVKEEIIGAPHTSLNGDMSGSRRYLPVRFALEDIKAIKRERGGTVNDVVLAMVTGGLRALLLSRGETPAKDLRVQIPVNVRDADRAHAMGNQVTTLVAELPVNEEDPEARYLLVRDRARALKGSSQAVAGKGLSALSDALPPMVGAQLGRMLFNHARTFNLTVTNVPGPQTRFYAFGVPLREVLPLVPLFNTHRVGIAVVSYAGQMIFGLNADRPTTPDLAVLARGIEQSFTELAAGVPAAV